MNTEKKSLTLHSASNFLCTDKIDLKKYFNDLSKEYFNLKLHIDESNLELSTQVDAPLLEKICSIDKLTVGDEEPQKEFKDWVYVMQDNLDYNVLNTTKCTQKWISNSHHLHKLCPDPNPLINLDGCENRVKPYKDFLVVVQVYAPFMAPVTNFSIRTNWLNKIKYLYEIVLHSSQTLTDLKDKVVCSSDFGSSKEIINLNKYMKKPDLPIECHSSCFFIEDCFYDDMRHPEAETNSSVVINWAKEKKIGDYSAEKMETKKIEDLQIRFHRPYLYQHCVDCEHLITFSDARLISSSDKQSIDEYPYFQTENKFNTVTCYICQHSTATYLVKDCDRLPYKYSYLCQDCLLSYCYTDANGKEKIGTFKLYPYFDKSGIILKK